MYDYQSVKDFFTQNGCELLEEDYFGYKVPMKYKCVCGFVSSIAFDNFKNGQRCIECKRKTLKKLNTKYTYIDVQNYFKEQGCELLSKNYVSSNVPLDFMCACGQKSSVTFGHFRMGRKCMGCKSNRAADSRRKDVKEVQDIFAKDGYELLSKEYINTKIPLKFRCPNGHEHTITLNNWKIGRRCRKCYEGTNVGENHPNWLKDRDLKSYRDKLRSRYYSILHDVLNKTGTQKQCKSEILMGYTWLELKSHLESFPEFEVLSQGLYHVDHIMPIQAFIEYNIGDIKIINALENLRPMAGSDNSSKGGRYDKQKFEAYLTSKRLL